MKRFLYRLFRRQYKVSIMDLYNAIKQVANERGEDYITCEVKVDHTGTIILRGYISGTSWEEGSSIEEVCNKLKGSFVRESEIKDFYI